MKKVLSKLSLLMVAALLVTALSGCFENPTEPIAKTKFNFEVSSTAINPASAYLQSVDLITYTAAGVGAVNEMPTNNALPWSAEAEVELGSGAGLSISYISSTIDPTFNTRMVNTQFTLKIKKDGNEVKSEKVVLEEGDPQYSISWSQE